MMKTKKLQARVVKLLPLRWIMYDLQGKRHVHEIPNPIQGIVNGFNKDYAKFGMRAEAG